MHVLTAPPPPLRGNHDAFNVPNFEHKDNYFRVYSVSYQHGQQLGVHRPHPGSPHYSFVHDTRCVHVCVAPTNGALTNTMRASLHSFGSYKFVSFDAVVEQAPTNHFFGEVTAQARQYLADATSDWQQHNNIVVFGHYPIASTVGAGDAPVSLYTGLATATQQQPQPLADGPPTVYDTFTRHHVTAYLSGHLHGLVGKLLHPWFGESLHARHLGGRSSRDGTRVALRLSR